MANIHASCVDFEGRGILLLGDSGSGKSGLCLDLILNHGATLVADDRVELKTQQTQVIASCPEKLAGLLEVRNVGILRLPYKKESSVALVACLEPAGSLLERLPAPEYYQIADASVPMLHFRENEASSAAKIIAFLRFPHM